jgi:hypothetical protein
MNIDTILLIIIIIYLIFSKINKNKENFTLSIDNKNKVITFIKEIYNTDLDSLRNLVEITNKICDGNNFHFFNNLMTISGTINSNYINTKTLDIKGKYGTTHFNHKGKGATIIRDDFYIRDSKTNTDIILNKNLWYGSSWLGHEITRNWATYKG